MSEKKKAPKLPEAGQWPDKVAPWALLGAGILAATNNVPGRIMLLVCAAFTLVVAFFWFQGYFYIDQLQSTARLLCFVCLVGLAITMRNKPQRRY